MKHKKFASKSVRTLDNKTKFLFHFSNIQNNETWNIAGQDLNIKVRLPKNEYLLGFIRVDTDKWLAKSSNGWYWNLYQDKKGKFKLQKLN